jgi:hypothetical protein
MDLKAGDKKKIVEFLLVFLIIVVFLLLVYFVVYEDIFLIFTRDCPDEDCFKQNLVKCRRAQHVSDKQEAAWMYTIKGREEGRCEVEVELLSIKEGEIDLRSAEGKKMTCYLPLDAVTVPGEDLSLCTGILKEELQDLIIKRMHSYILENLGQINEELNRAL